VSYTKYVKLYYYDKDSRVFWLPPITRRNKKSKVHPIDVKKIMPLRDLQKKTVDEVSNMIEE
jgi:hypothetical protein